MDVDAAKPTYDVFSALRRPCFLLSHYPTRGSALCSIGADGASHNSPGWGVVSRVFLSLSLSLYSRHADDPTGTDSVGFARHDVLIDSWSRSFLEMVIRDVTCRRWRCRHGGDSLSFLLTPPPCSERLAVADWPAGLRNS
jgi:hypothetical protein